MNNALTTTLNDVEQRCKAGYYNYIIIGSGMGGGTLARCLIEGDSGHERADSPRVLVIERGGLQFSTHCINTPSPGWYRKEGPSMSTDLVFQSVKSPIATVSSRSVPYAGGPVHCLGGRSNVWGMYTPPLDRMSVKEKLGEEIEQYLFHRDGYIRAYNLLSNGGDLRNPYPMSGSVTTESIQYVIHDVVNDFNRLTNMVPSHFICQNFTVCPMGAEFVPKDPSRRLYQTAMGGYSAVNWMLERCYNSSEALTILPNTQVITVNYNHDHENHKKEITSITVLDPGSKHNQLRNIPTGGAKVILSSGTIDTAVIALRSGLDQIVPDLIGVGLTDHDIWGVRFELCTKKNNPVNALLGQALRLQTWATLFADDGSEDTPYLIEKKAPFRLNLPSNSRRRAQCLINITINATSFLAPSLDSPMMYLDENGKLVSKAAFDEKFQSPSHNYEKFSLQVVFEFDSPLKDDNKVLNLPRSTPTIEIPSREDKRPYLPSMRIFALEAALLCGWLNTHGFSRSNPAGGQGAQSHMGGHDVLAAAEVGPPALAEPVDVGNGYQPGAPGWVPGYTWDEVRDPPTNPCWRWCLPSNEIRARSVIVDRAPFGVVAHEVGTMRMGVGEKGVVNTDLQFKGLDNLFVCDLSVFPWSPTANPSLTLVALAQRLASDLTSPN
ncbi:uncharacterized protein DFL_005246 [Arthrobotrys flagrans]|uniref:Glucose-methanol-choline oxidoreductase C-terminal domain-containing protein n=1 Tax=Arthrobotrys flagrans TaxID=97331 RepID=A0A437A7A0_ARTFL|nr:hypothetical protein DFL_005246 [Arthrobotrys flagrans]